MWGAAWIHLVCGLAASVAFATDGSNVTPNATTKLDGPAMVRLPCLGAENTQNECQAFFPRCGDLKNVAFTRLDEQIKRRIDYYYQGLDISLSETKDPAHPVGSAFIHPCDLQRSGNAEVTHDQQGRSCGKPTILVEKKGKLVTKQIEGHGERENAYQMGAFVHFVDCGKKQVLREILSGKLEVHPGCRAMGADYQRLVAKFSNIANESPLPKEFCEKKPDFSFCYKKRDDLGVDSVKLNEEICYLHAASEIIGKGVFENLLECEVFERAERRFAAAFEDEKNTRLFSDILKKELIKPCMLEGGEYCKQYYILRMTIPSDAMINSCMAEQYNPCSTKRYPQVLKKYLDLTQGGGEAC